MAMLLRQIDTRFYCTRIATCLFVTFISLGLLSSTYRKPHLNEGNWQLENAFPKLTFNRPVELTFAQDGSNRLFVLEQEGLIRVFDNESTTQTADEGEMGLLGLAFHPDFKRNGYL